MDSADTGEETRWAGTADVRVVDSDGAPVAGALVMQGGSTDWQTTGADGTVSLEVTDDGLTDRYLLAGLEGWFSGGVDLDDHDGPDGVLEIVLRRLPEVDNPAYSFQKGGDGASPSTAECGHCHNSIGDGWAASAHAKSASNTRTRDLFLGAASEALDCEALGGWQAEGASAGDPGAAESRCYVGVGVLPLLNDCGAEGEVACDSPDADLSAFGSCGDCHSPAMNGAVPGQVNLAHATGVAFDEGVTCDFCHKVQAVLAGGGPGLDGAIALLRPSEDTMVVGQEYDPITFGPYPDVIVAIMKGSYAPGMREAGWCAACHEYARPTLHGDHAVDSERWPSGLPIHETWSEWLAGPYGGTPLTCQSCHMPVLEEESSTYDVTDKGLAFSVDQGWPREVGEVRQHSFTADLGGPSLTLSAEATADGVEVSVKIANISAGHAVPTGDPLKQYVLLLDVTDAAGDAVVPSAGRAVPGTGGWLARGTVGEDVSIDGSTVTFAEAVPTGAVALRLVRPSGEYSDHEGPGTGHWDSATAEQKGLEIGEPAGARAVSASDGAVVTLDALLAAEPGDVVYLLAEHHLAGAPGWMWSKTVVDGAGNAGVAHYLAADVQSDNRLKPGGSETLTWRFEGAGALTVQARLLKRRYAAPVADVYGWDPGDVEVDADEVVVEAR